MGSMKLCVTACLKAPCWQEQRRSRGCQVCRRALCLQLESSKSPLLAVTLQPRCGATCWFVRDFQTML